MTHHTGSDEGLSEAERLAAAINVGRLTWVGGGDGDFDLHLALAILPTVKTLAARAAAPDALRERVEALADRWEIFSGSATDERISSLLASMAAEVRAALAERPTDGAGT